MKRNIRSGFTIVEVITAVTIVAIMVAILIPALAQVRKTARKVRQKAQFTAITVGLESFKNDFGYYPDSSQLDRNDNQYNGAQKLAEAMVGQDLLGVHPSVAPKFDYKGENDVFKKNGQQLTDQQLYTADDSLADYESTWQTVEENVECRKGPYFEAEKANAVDLRYLYDNTGNLSVPSGVAGTMFVITDSFAKKNSTYKDEFPKSNGRVGMPILYFKANTRKISQNDTVLNNRIYDWMDNKDVVELKSPWDDPVYPDDYLGKTNSDTTNSEIFKKLIVDPTLTLDIAASKTREIPYNSKSYILMSAGEDGIYGTEDDVFNFDKK